MLLDFCSACATVSEPWFDVSWITAGPILYVPGDVLMIVFGVTLRWSIDSATTSGLIVEPGSNVSITARLRNCWPVSRARSFGSNVG